MHNILGLTHPERRHLWRQAGKMPAFPGSCVSPNLTQVRCDSGIET